LKKPYNILNNLSNSRFNFDGDKKKYVEFTTMGNTKRKKGKWKIGCLEIMTNEYQKSLINNKLNEKKWGVKT
jgi:hypothetical protein